MQKILVIDDQAGMRRSLAILLAKEGYDVIEAENGEHAITFFNNNNFDLVITDLKMSPGTGMDILYFIKEKYPQTDVIIMTGYGTVDSAVLAMRMGAFDYISKPFKHEEILHRVRKTLTHAQSKKDISFLKKETTPQYGTFPLIGKSKQIKNIISLVQKVARVTLPVLITGDTGTGKNLVATTIHSLSNRRDHPYVSLNCAGVPEYLLESELFGHIKGAFTGALLDRKGLFESAAKGTILLDEIGSMPYSLQAKLLDILQDKMIRPVGSDKNKKINARILVSTNRDLKEAIVEKDFREDLYYRIKVAHIHIPPLRERREDIPALAHYFLNQFKKEFHRPDLDFAENVIGFLMDHSFPGNVRELYNCISSAAALAPESILTVQDMNIELIPNRTVSNSATTGEDDASGTMETLEFETIIKSIEKYSHNLTKVCEELGIGRTTLWRKMKKYGID